MTVRLGDWTTGEQRLLLWRCESCGHATSLPHVGCPRCGTASVAAFEADRSGVCTARTVLPPGPLVDHEVVLVLVTVDTGACFMTRAQPDVSIGDRVRIELMQVESHGLLPVSRREH